VSNGVAAALLGKVYVYLKDWANAKIYLDMIPGYGYALQNDFASLWKLENEDNAEIIFAIKYIEGTNGHGLSSAYLPFGGKTGVASSGLESVFPSWDLHRLYEVGDTRKAASITEFYKTPTPANSPTVWFPHVSKYEVKHLINSSGIDLPVLRYADVILLMAEVQYGLNRPDLALVELNKIRTRAFGNSSKNYILSDIATAASFTDKILLERRLEFAFENERWFDLVRTGRLLTEMTFEERGYNPSTQTALKFTLQPKPHYVLYPIPQRQIEVYNPGVLVQNQDY
jgi:starch-binding outer membrane protein, SusD/RagB family